MNCLDMIGLSKDVAYSRQISSNFVRRKTDHQAAIANRTMISRRLHQVFGAAPAGCLPEVHVEGLLRGDIRVPRRS